MTKNLVNVRLKHNHHRSCETQTKMADVFPFLKYFPFSGGARVRRLGGQTEEGRREKYLCVSGHAPGKILSSRISEMPFPAFWGIILQNCEDYKTSCKIHKRQHISFHINYKILLKNSRAF